MQELKIEGHFALIDQTWKNISQGVNIITSVNGGGKTSLLQHIFNTHHKDYVIRNISENITQFQANEDLADYKHKMHTSLRNNDRFTAVLRSSEKNYQNFMNDYKTLIELRSCDDRLPNECNEYFKELGLKIRIQSWKTNSGMLKFYRENKPETLIEFANISTGEKTAFVLWLIMRSNPTPQIILLDEFDSGLDDDIIPKFMENLVKIAEKGVQIFISTHRKNSLRSWDNLWQEENSDGTRKYTIWNINNDTGIIS